MNDYTEDKSSLDYHRNKQTIPPKISLNNQTLEEEIQTRTLLNDFRLELARLEAEAYGGSLDQQIQVFNSATQNILSLITRECEKAKENGFYMGCGVAGVDVYKVPELWRKCSDAPRGTQGLPAQNIERSS